MKYVEFLEYPILDPTLVTRSPIIVVYETKTCPKCKALEAAMPPASFKTVDMSTPCALTELRINGVFATSAPVLRIGDEFYTVEDLFEGNNLKTDKLSKILGRP
jgi:glutaredoxin